jgi:hypothetical protein
VCLWEMSSSTVRAGSRYAPTTWSLAASPRPWRGPARPPGQAMNNPQALGLTPDEDTTLNALLHKVLAAMNDS